MKYPIILGLGLIGGVLGAAFLSPEKLIEPEAHTAIATVDSTLLFYHREAVAELMGQPNAHQIAVQYRKNLPHLLQDRLETRNLLVFDRLSVLGGVPDLTGALAEDYLQALDRQSTQGRRTQ